MSTPATYKEYAADCLTAMRAAVLPEVRALLLAMAQRAEYTAQWTDLFAALIIASVPVLILFAALQNQIERGMTAGALKG